MIHLAIKDHGVVFSVRAQPRASRSEIAGEQGGALKIRLAAPPVDGEANEELIRVIAKLFEVSRAEVTIVSGQKSKNKIVKVTGISIEEVERILRLHIAA